MQCSPKSDFHAKLTIGITYFWASPINPLVPRVQKIICNLTLNRLLVIEFVKKMVYLGAHYSERQGLMANVCTLSPRNSLTKNGKIASFII